MSLEATLAELVQMLDQRLREITAELERRSPPEPTTRGIADAYLLWLLEHGSLTLTGAEPILKIHDNTVFDLCELKTRVRKRILKTGCATAEELAAFGRKRLLEIRYCGQTTVSEIRAFLREKHGLELAD
jgi:hypothetical protein